METIPEVDIDKNGKFKYILLKLTEDGNNRVKYAVRGYSNCEFHDKIFDQVKKRELMKATVHADVLGGGKLDCNPDTDTIVISGDSQTYGRADHGKTVEILKKHFGNKYNIVAE